MHVHIGVVELAQFALQLLIVGFFLRILAAKLHDRAAGKALAFIY